MKKNFLLAFIFLSTFSFSQKRYDCIVITRYEGDNPDSLKTHRFVGYLKGMDDSTVYLIAKQNDKVFNWQDIEAVKFRKHNGFMRTVLPLAAIASFSLSEIELNTPPIAPSYFKSELIPLLTIAYSVILTIPAGTIIYFATRNHKFIIHSYPDFIKLKHDSSKYIFK
jgi:hypothetical protein